MIHVFHILLLMLLRCSLGLVIRTSHGVLEGAEIKYSNKAVHMFKHVPFAAPPIGNLRFQLPAKVEPWEGVRKATEYGPACLSNTSRTTTLQKWIDEDCLHNNIFTSEKCIVSSFEDTKYGKCPVIVYLHGGTFLYDSAVMYNDDKIIENFASKDIVFVITAMRLGFFGLLTFEEDEVVPRNLPFYDTKMSLEWLQDSISTFGGDPHDVTLLGHSSGCSQAIEMTFSRTFDPNMKLFHKVMCMSPGNGIRDTTKRLTMSWKFAQKAGCAAEKQNPSSFMIRNVVECLQHKNAMGLLRIQREMEDNDNMVPEMAVFVPPLFHGDTWVEFLNRPNNTQRKILIGVNTKEFTFAFDPTTDRKVASYLDYLGFRNPLIIGKKYNDDMKYHALENDGRSMATQKTFAYVIQVLNSYTKAGGEAYLYQFSFPKQSYHNQDMYYIMGTHPFEMDENERALSIIYPKMFSDFVKTGIPGDAIRYNRSIMNYYNINFNVSDGTRPHNSIGFEKKIMDYLTKNLTEYDREISIQRLQNSMKQLSPKSFLPSFNGLSLVNGSLNNSKFISLMKNVLISGVFTLIGMAVGWWLRGFKNQKNQNINEKTPLLI